MERQESNYSPSSNGYIKLLATLVKGDPKVPFSIATIWRCREGCYSFHWITPLYPRSLPYNAVLRKAASSTIFWVFGMTQPGIEPQSLGPLANTLLILLMYQKEYASYRKCWQEGELVLKVPYLTATGTICDTWSV